MCLGVPGVGEVLQKVHLESGRQAMLEEWISQILNKLSALFFISFILGSQRSKRRGW